MSSDINDLTYLELQDKILWKLCKLFNITFINYNFDIDALGEQIVNSSFTKNQLKMIYKGLLEGRDMSLYAYPNYEYVKMYEILQWLLSDLALYKYLFRIII